MRRLASLVVVVAILYTWEMLGRAFYRFRILTSTPLRIIEYSQHHHVQLFRDLAYTSFVAVVGFAFALVIGALLGVAAFRYERLRNVTVNVLQALQVVPVLVFAPFVTMALDVGVKAHTTIAFLVGIFPFTSVLLDSLQRLPGAYFDLARLHQLPFARALMHIYLPLTAPSAFAAARVSFAVSVVGATVAEFTGSRSGLGKNVFEAAIRLEPELLTISTVGITLLGATGISLLRVLERRLVKWRL